jgi:cell division protein FtsZ
MPAPVPVEAPAEPAWHAAAMEEERLEAQPVAPVSEPVFASDAKMFEPLRAAGFSMEGERASVAPLQPDLGLGEPASAVVRNIQPIARIVDPSVAEDEEPLFASSRYEEGRRQKGGWLSLFGGRRQQEPDSSVFAAVSRASSVPQPTAEAVEDAGADDNADLEIPSFLRRLAN